MEESYIDIYCERMSGAFWAEPINAITNFAFLVAAFFAYRFWKAKGSGEKDILLLILTLAIVGVGSFTFHSFAQPWSLLADVLPIAAFIHIAVFSAAYRVFGLGRAISAAVMLAFATFSYSWENLVPVGWLNGSVTYLPAFFALLVMSIGAYKCNLQAAKPFVTAVVLLIISLSFRSVDMASCELTHGIGTHFMWHVINGLLMFKVIQGLLLGEVRKS